ADAAFHDVDQRLEPLILARRDPVLLRILAVVLPSLLVLPGGGEGLDVEGLDTRSRGGVARLSRRVLARHVLAERELDRLRRALEEELSGLVHPPARLDDRALAADRVRAAVEDLGDGHTTGEG